MDDLTRLHELRGYATVGLTLQASKTNPKVRRWIRSQAVQKGLRMNLSIGLHGRVGEALGSVAGQSIGHTKGSEESGANIGHVAGTIKGLAHEVSVDHPGNATYWVTHHAPHVADIAKRHGISHLTAALALAAHAESHIKAAHSEHMASGEPRVGLHRFAVNHHSEIAKRTKKSFEEAVAAHGK